MTQEELKSLLQKIKDGSASDGEKAIALKEVNGSIQTLNSLTKELIAEMEKEVS